MIGPTELAILAGLAFLLYVARRRGGPSAPGAAPARVHVVKGGWTGIAVALGSALLAGAGIAVGVLWFALPEPTSSIVAGAAAGLAGGLLVMSAAAFRREL